MEKGKAGTRQKNLAQRRKGAKKKTQRAIGIQQLGVLPLRLCGNMLFSLSLLACEFTM
jgi:hypothetical protein